MGLTLLILFGTIGGIAAGQDYRNQTVECAFREMDKCLRPIGALGGNFSARYAQTQAEMSQTCQGKGNFQTCVRGLPQKCNAPKFEITRKIDGIWIFVEKLCNNTSEHQNFLNSSMCYNRNLKTRQDCVAKYAANGTDAKTLCCNSSDIRKCLEKDMGKVCPQNATSFQHHLGDTYGLFTDTLCAPYFRLCSGAAAHALSLACLLLLLLTAKVTPFSQLG